MIIAKWGNSLAVRIPASLVQALDLKEGDDVELQLAGSKQFVVSKAQEKPSLAQRFASLHQLLAELKEDSALPTMPRTNRQNDFISALDASDAV
ncbi:MAG: AbrB/MazE/SpoVT family DNA-binding domain-containing protein [Thiolinea sp.]